MNNNTPDRLYYYCEVHPKMGGMINITGTTTEVIPTTTGQNGTVEIETVNSNGGVVSVKNLEGGSGYNECMANVATKGGNGTGFTIEIVKTDGGSIVAIAINSKGTNYQDRIVQIKTDGWIAIRFSELFDLAIEIGVNEERLHPQPKYR